MVVLFFYEIMAGGSASIDAATCGSASWIIAL
jgi:hypothetical protein